MRHSTSHDSCGTGTLKYLNGLLKVTKEFLEWKHSN